MDLQFHASSETPTCPSTPGDSSQKMVDINKVVSTLQAAVDPENNEKQSKFTLNPLAIVFIPGCYLGESTEVADGSGREVEFDTNNELDYLQCGLYEPQNEFEVLFQYDPDAAMLNDHQDLKGILFKDEGLNSVEQPSNLKMLEVKLGEMVLQSGKHNFQGLRIPLRAR